MKVQHDNVMITTEAAEAYYANLDETKKCWFSIIWTHIGHASKEDVSEGCYAIKELKTTADIAEELRDMDSIPLTFINETLGVLEYECVYDKGTRRTCWQWWREVDPNDMMA